jgi:peptidyl-prolyl cis-trans isomerase C
MPVAHARHILVDTEKECKDLLQQLQDGADFNELALQSKCPSGQQGGDLGSFSQGQMVPEFDKVVFEAPVGLFPEPVKTDFGYHIIDIIQRDDNATMPKSNVPMAHARHILVETEKECNELIAQLKAGADFAELAKNSKCPSGKRGGDLGTFAKGQMVPEFDKVIFAAPIGLYEKPVKTDFGYHIIDILDRNADDLSQAGA